jgi:hypothetical protein
MDKPIVKTMEQRLDEIEKLFIEGLNMTLQKVGELVVDAIDADPDKFYESIKARPGWILNSHAISMLERIGRHQLHPNLALMSGSGPERLKKMPFSLQEKHLTESFELLILNEDGSTDKILVALSDLTPAQVAQLFDRDTLRSLPAQRAWLESERAKRAQPKPTVKAGYKIVGKRVTFYEECTLSARELARILAEIE